MLDAILPQYVAHRVFNCLLQSAASELAARQRAMKSATDNADELIRKYTRLANQARQAQITQETVSYTHLDVYKRQTSSWPPSPVAGSRITT